MTTIRVAGSRRVPFFVIKMRHWLFAAIPFTNCQANFAVVPPCPFSGPPDTKGTAWLRPAKGLALAFPLQVQPRASERDQLVSTSKGNQKILQAMATKTNPCLQVPVLDRLQWTPKGSLWLLTGDWRQAGGSKGSPVASGAAGSERRLPRRAGLRQALGGL